MPRQKNLVGVRSGHLVVLAYAGRHPKGGATWECLCELCGKKVVLMAQRIAQRQKACSIACGVSNSNKARSKHGMWQSSEYRIWHGAVERCRNPNNAHWDRYGGRGIKVCPEWEKDFQAFFEYMGPRPSTKHSLDRIDNNKGYEPGNVRWATQKQQIRNTERTIKVTMNGETKLLIEWAEQLNVKYSTVVGRWFKGVRGEELFIKGRLGYGAINKWRKR